MVKLTPYVLGAGLGILCMLAKITPDVIFAIVTICFEILAFLVYILFYSVYKVLLDDKLKIKVDKDPIAKSLFFECLVPFVLVFLLPLKLNVTTYNTITYLWMSIVFSHAFLFCELVYCTTNTYAGDIKNLK